MNKIDEYLHALTCGLQYYAVGTQDFDPAHRDSAVYLFDVLWDEAIRVRHLLEAVS